MTREELFDKLKAGARWDVGVSINRSNSLPLDANSIFESYEIASTYASKNKEAIAALGLLDNAYIGQILTVVENNAVKIYVIDNNQELQPVGNADGLTITTDDKGNFVLYGFEEAVTGTYPRVAERTVGEGDEATIEKYIEWVDLEIPEVPAVTEGTYIDVTTNEDGDYIVTHENAPTLTRNDANTESSRFVSEITRDDQGHITGYKTEIVNIPDVTLDEVTIARIPEDQEKAGAIEIKGFHAQTENGLIPQIKIEGSGEERTRTLEWVSVQEAIAGIEDKDTVTGVRSVNDGGVIVTKLPNPDEDDDRTYTVEHGAAPTTGNATTKTADGIQGTYVTEVLVDKFGHVAGVKTAVDKDTHYEGEIYLLADEANNGALLKYKETYDSEEVPDSTSTILVKGTGIATVTTDNNNTELVINVPEVQIENLDPVDPSDTLDTAFVVGDITVSNNHTLEIEYLNIPTKAYVDRVASGATDYLGTVGTAEQLAALNPGKGDFVRVSTAFGDYHASDMLICETPKDGENAAIWSVIHGEIDQNTWVANTKDADGYVTKGEGEVKKVWATDSEQNPGWNVAYDTAATTDTLAQRQSNGQLTVVETPIADTDAASKKYVDDAKAEALAAIPTVNDGKFTVKGDGTYLTGTGSMTANQAGETEVTITFTQDFIDRLDDTPIVVTPLSNNGPERFAMFNKDNNLVSGGSWAPNAYCSDGNEDGGGYIGIDASGCECLGENEPYWFGFSLSGSDTICITNSDADDHAVTTQGTLEIAPKVKEKINSAVQTITTIDTSADHAHGSETNCGGLKATKTGDTVNLEIDDSITFILNCGSAADLL